MDQEHVIIEPEGGLLVVSILVNAQEWARASDEVGARYAHPSVDQARASAIKALATLDWVSSTLARK